MADFFDLSTLRTVPAEEAPPQTESILKPNYVKRERGILGGQEVGGLSGALAGAAAGAPLGVPGMIAGSAIGAGLGGATGEAVEQIARDEPISPTEIGKAGLEEAAWDLGGNLVLRIAGKVIKVGADKLGFSSKDAPDATKAAQRFLEQQGSSLPLSTRTGSNLLATVEGFVNTPVTFTLFKDKSKEISDAISTGAQDIIKSLIKSGEFETALRSGTSAQRASGEVLHNFIKNGSEELDRVAGQQYGDLFKDVTSTIPTMNLKSWAAGKLSNPAGLTSAQKNILERIEKELPASVSMQQLHEIRSMWKAQARDKFNALGGSEADSRAVSTITDLTSRIDGLMDAAAGSTLKGSTLTQYRTLTKNYRDAIQSLDNDSIIEAMRVSPEEVGGYLFAAGKETTIKDLYKAAAAAGTLTKNNSGEVVDALRVGYLDAMFNTPDNILKFAKDLEQNKKFANTFNQLFQGRPDQINAIKDMAEAAKAGLVQAKTLAGINLQTASTVAGGAGSATAFGTGYYFLLSDEQQQRLRDSSLSLLVSGTGLLLSQRKLAKLLLDPRGAKAVSLLSKGASKIGSASGFTKLVVEPIVNLLSNEPIGKDLDAFLYPDMGTDISNLNAQ